MLQIHIPSREFWDSNKNEFLYTKEVSLRMEHSLISLTKWEQKYKKPFLADKQKTIGETLDYFRFMCIDKNADLSVFDNLPTDIYTKIMNYISDPMTATTINRKNIKTGRKGRSQRKEILTSELIYYYMATFNIPYSCEKWHLNNLLTLIEVASVKTSEMNGGGKVPKGQAQKYYSELNKANRALLGTKG